MMQPIEKPAFAEVTEVLRKSILRNFRKGLRKFVFSHHVDISGFAEVPEVLRKFLLRNLRQPAEVCGGSAEVNLRYFRKGSVNTEPTDWKQTIFQLAEVGCGGLRKSSRKSLILLAEVCGSSSPPIIPPTHLRGSRPANAGDIRCGGDINLTAAVRRRTSGLRQRHLANGGVP